MLSFDYIILFLFFLLCFDFFWLFILGIYRLTFRCCFFFGDFIK